MRRLVVTSVVLSLAALAGCGKSGTQSQDQGAQATASGQPANPQGAQAAAPTEEQMKQAQAALPEPYKSADLANGKAKFAFCSSCHTITPGGPNMTGPNLYGVVGTKTAAIPNYNFSDALKAANFTWDGAHLDAWITNPRAVVPGTKMTYFGMKDAKDRTDLIAYLMVNAPSAAAK